MSRDSTRGHLDVDVTLESESDAIPPRNTTVWREGQK